MPLKINLPYQETLVMFPIQSLKMPSAFPAQAHSVACYPLRLMPNRYADPQLTKISSQTCGASPAGESLLSAGFSVRRTSQRCLLPSELNGQRLCHTGKIVLSRSVHSPDMRTRPPFDLGCTDIMTGIGT